MSKKATPKIKELPHSRELEEALLGAIILDASCLDHVVAMVRPADLFVEDHRRIFRIMLTMHESGAEIDSRSIVKYLATNDRADLVRMCVALPNAVPSASTFDTYARGVSELGHRRRLIASCEAAANELYDAGSLLETVKADLSVSIDASTNLGDRSTRGAALVREGRVLIQRLLLGHSDAISTGLKCLDDALGGGLHPKNLHILAGRPGMGKTAAMLQIVRNAANEGIPVKIFSCEMSREQLMLRIISAEAGVSLGSIRDHGLKKSTLSDRKLGALKEAAGDLERIFAAAPVDVDETAGIAVEDLVARSLAFVRTYARPAKGQPTRALICLDYLQLATVAASRRSGTRELEVSTISQRLKGLAKTAGCPVLCLAQLNRKVEDRPDKRPRSSDLRESGGIEQDADVIAMLYRESVYDDAAPSDQAEAIITKNRHGSPRKVDLVWRGNVTKFFDPADPRSFDDADPVPEWAGC